MRGSITVLFKITVFMPLVLALSGCETLSAPIGHVIAIHRTGAPANPSTGKLISNDEYEDHIGSVLEIDENKEIVIFIHGGLNTTRQANNRANRLTEEIQADGMHPLFVHWRSGFFTSELEHLFRQRQGESWSLWTGIPSSPFILLADLGRAVGRMPIVWWYKTNSMLKAMFPGKYTSERDAMITSQVAKNAEEFAELPNLVDYRSDKRKLGDNLLNLGQTVLGLSTAPLFDAGGTGSWNVMKRRTGLMFARARPGNQAKYETFDEYSELKKGALAKFLDELVTHQGNRSKKSITLVGHSMGTIIANEIVRGWPELKFSKIIYLAAASPISHFQETIVPYMKDAANQDTKFYNIVLHPVAENSEAHGLGFAGTGSLLNQIDNFYESPVIESHRTLGRWVNVMNGLNYFDEEIRDRVYVRAMPLDERYPQRHGHFSSPRYIETGKFWRGELGTIGR